MSDVTQARNENGVPLLEWDDSWRGAYRAQSKTAEVVGNMTPDFLGSVATTLTWKDLSLNIGLDMRFGGLVASYCNLYGTQAGWTESSLQYRDPEHGGMTWTSPVSYTHLPKCIAIIRCRRQYNDDATLVGYQIS